MRTAVVDEDGVRGQGEGAAEDLDEEHAAEGEPEEGTGGLCRRGGGGGHDGEVGGEEVREREEAQEGTIGAERAEEGVDARIDDQLERDADGAEDGHGEADGPGGHAETAGKVEG